MNKKVFICFFIIIFIVLIFLSILKNDKEVVLLFSFLCTKHWVTKVDGEAFEKYTFLGIGNVVHDEVLFVKLNIDDKKILNDYKNIIESDELCKDIEVFDNYITYSCKYNLINNSFYDNLKSDDGSLTFSVLENEFNKDNYTCIYK